MAVKELNGRELAGFIKERQAKQGRQLEAQGVKPKLAVVMTTHNPVIESYVKMKRRYGRDIGVEVDIQQVEQSKLQDTIQKNNEDPNLHAMIVQLPLEDPSETEEALEHVLPEKDIDGLGPKPMFEPATATAILWLLAGYNIDLRGKKIALIGRGKLVGAPLKRMLLSAGHEIVEINRSVESPAEKCYECEIIITATGKANLVTNDWVAPGAVVVDAGTVGEGGKVVGDVADEVRAREDIKAITPLKGGVGPLTVCALFENVISAASQKQQI